MSTGMWNTFANAAGLGRPKKKFHFDVTFCLQDLRNCTYVSGVIFAKIRLKSGGSFSVHSDRSAKLEGLQSGTAATFNVCTNVIIKQCLGS